MNSVTAQGDSWRGTGGKEAAVAPVTLTGAYGTGHTESESGPRRQGGADRGDETSGNHSEHKRRDHQAGSRSGYQETQADTRSVAKGAGTRTTTVQCSTRLTTAWQRPQYAGE